MVDLELYRIFVVVAKAQNITKASEILHISQPAVSKHIQNLEGQLNISLFKRNRYGLELTEIGEKLFSDIKESVNVLVSAEERIKSIRNINFGVQILKLFNLYGNSIAKFYNVHSQNMVVPIHENINVLLEMLNSQNVDIVISKKPQNVSFDTSISFIHLGYLHDVLIANPKNPMVSKVFTKQDFMNETIYTPRKTSDTTQNLINTLNLDDSHYKFVTNETVINMVKSEKTYGVISKEYIKDELNEGSLAVLKTDFELPPAEYGLFINHKNTFKELNDLIDFLKEQKIETE